MNNILAKIAKFNLKTIFFNLHYFPFRTAIKFPVFVSANTKILHRGGKVVLEGKIKPGMVELGYGHLGNFDKMNSRFVWDNLGTVTFQENAFIGHGSKIKVLPTGSIYFGANFITTAESSFISRKSIRIGSNCLFSWEILVMDTDFHFMYDEQGTVMNPDADITLGDNVWVGCRCLILKGAIIPTNSVIAAATTVTKKLREENSIYAGMPVAKVKSFGYWKL